MPTTAATLDALKARFGELPTSEFRGETRLVVRMERLADVLEFLKQSAGFDLLVDVTCVDCLNYRGATDRFGLAYLLANTVTNERLTVRCFVNEPDLSVPSVVPLWRGADWLERVFSCRRMSAGPTRTASPTRSGTG